MDKFSIIGGTSLRGIVRISGAKNAVLPILAATLLTHQKIILENVPHLRDVQTMIGLLRCLGVSITELNNNVLEIDASNLQSSKAPYELVKTMRASIVVLGPLLTRLGHAEVSLPGGCAIGPRPVNLHIDALVNMGADIIVNTDADFQYNQKQIPGLVKPIIDGNADMVLGSRFSGKIEEMSAQKYWGNKAMSFLISFITGLKISDAQTGFRAFSREAALKINVFSDYTYTQETILEAWEKKLVIKEVPVEFRKRHGESRLISNIFVYAKRAGFTVIETYLSYKPLRVFLIVGGILVALSLATGYRVIAHFLETGLVTPYFPTALLSALLLVVGVQVLIIGLIAEMIKRTRKVQEQILYNERKKRLS